MLLYFDTYITDIPRSVNRKLDRLLSEVRLENTSYRTQKKVDIFKYTLASFAHFDWSHIVINVDGVNEFDVLDSLSFAKNLFPTANVSSTRSDTGLKYSNVLSKFIDVNPWVFFSPHNDHPYVGSVLNPFEKLITLAEEVEVKFNLPVTVLYSHFTESVNSIKPDRFLYGFTGEYVEVLFQTDYAYVLLRNEIPLLSTHIVRATLLHDLMYRAGNNRVITTECLGKYLNINYKCIQIIPKVECCRHYDGYMHTYSVVNDYVSSDKVPPLFIPNGFFENNIHIRYGFDEYFLDCVNINPSRNKYIFESKFGTDLGNLLTNIPYFWRKRISEVSVNPEFVEPLLDSVVLLKKIYNPWENYSKLKILCYIFLRRHRNFLFKSLFGLFLLRLKFSFQKSKPYIVLRYFYRKIISYYGG